MQQANREPGSKSLRVLLTGSCSGGKTSTLELIEADKDFYTDNIYGTIHDLTRTKPKPILMHMVHEIARQLKHKVDAATQQNELTQMILEGRIQQYDETYTIARTHPQTQHIHLFDRGIITCAAYSKYFADSNYQDILSIAAQRPYDLIFYFPFWEDIYKQDSGRQETPRLAANLSQSILEVLDILEFPYITVPFFENEDKDASMVLRCHFIINKIVETLYEMTIQNSSRSY